MRITNNIITRNTKTNINNNKIYVDKYNTQMTTQKKIQKAYENPVIAIRALRYATTLGKITQYADNNIPDARSWLDVTETALTNMKDILTNVRTLCVNGSTDTLTADDRSTILNQLTKLNDQIYEEGNADYGGRTVFTGYRTTSRLTFDSDRTDVSYGIDQNFTYKDLEEHRYYTGDIQVPTDADSALDENDLNNHVDVGNYHRLRLAYDGIDSIDSFSFTVDGTDTDMDPDGSAIGGYTITTFDSEEVWEADGQPIEDDEIIVLKNSGEIVFGKDAYVALNNGKASFQVSYTKTGFEAEDIRPEYYFHCIDKTNPDDENEYNALSENADPDNIDAQGIENQSIEYTIAANADLKINTEAKEVFSPYIGRDVDELINVVQKAINAHEKVDTIKHMMEEAQYQDLDDTTNYQANLKSYLEAAKKEADYADDNLQKTYEQYITNFDNYLSDTNIAITNVGSTIDRLELTQTRVENQKMTVEELKSKNEDRDISDIIIDYYAAYNAYTSSLTAAGKLGEQTLLNYI